MRLNETVRVGVAVVVALVALVAVTFFLRGSLNHGNSYLQSVRFSDAQGIQTGAYVRVRGVDVGTVERVGLAPDGSALLTMRISDAYRVKPTDSIRISGGLLGFSPPWVEITPGARTVPAPMVDNALQGETATTADRVLGQTDQLLHSLTDLSGKMTRLADNLSQVLGDPKLRRNLMETTANFAKISKTGISIAENMRATTDRANHLVAGFSGTAARLDRAIRQADALFGGFRDTAAQSKQLMLDTRSLVKDTRGVVADAGTLVKNTNTVVQSAGGLVGDTRLTITGAREKLNGLVDNLNASVKQLDSTLAEARSFLGDSQLRADLKATAENVKEATENMRKITQDVHGLTSDPKVQEDLRASIASLRDATEEAASLFRKVGGAIGTGGQAAKSIRQKISEASLDADVVRQTRTNRTRLDFDATIPWSQRTFYRAGLYDVGESNKVILQAGQKVRGPVWARYGFYAGRVGAGLDFGNPKRPPFSIDWFGLDHPQVDARANLRVTRFLDLTAGVDNLTERPDPVIGLRFRK